jgi:hypothetical protein
MKYFVANFDRAASWLRDKCQKGAIKQPESGEIESFVMEVERRMIEGESEREALKNALKSHVK